MQQAERLLDLIQELTGYEHADTLGGDPRDFHTERVSAVSPSARVPSMDPEDPIGVRGTPETLAGIASALADRDLVVRWAKGPVDEDYGDDVLLVGDWGGES